MHFKLRLIPAATAAVLLVACGGGSNSPLTATSYTPTSGIAVDGYLRFSKVVCDTNDDLVAGATEPSVYTLGSSADSGKFTFPQGCINHALLVTEGTNADTGLMFTGMLMAPAGATVVSPLTTLMAAGMTQAQVITALGLPAGTDLLHTDPLAQTDLTTYKKALVVQQILQKSAELFAGMASLTGSVVNESVYAGLAVAFAAALKASPSPLIPPPVAAGATPEVDVAVLQNLLTVAAQVGQQILASGLFGTAAQTALSGIDLNAMAAVVAPALKVQAQTLLTAPDAASLKTATTAAQSSTYITDYIKSIETQLAGSSASPVDPTVITALSDTLARDVATGHNSISVGATDTVLLSFDETNPAFTGMGAYGGALPTTPPAPAGGSGNALKIEKPAGQEVWGGVYFGVAPIPFTADRKKISARVYSTRADAIIKFKVEIPGGSNVEIASSPTGPANAWSTVTWDFSGVDITKSYTTIAITPDPTAVTSGQSYYIDDVTLLAAAVTPTVSTGDYLSVANDAISLSDRGVTTPISLTAFQASPGISVKWPMSSPATLNVTLAKVGNFTMAPNQTLKAAVQITETTASGKGAVMAYVDNVGVSMLGNNITIAVPTSGAAAKVYGVSTDGAKKAVIDFSNSVANVTNTLSLSTANSILLGDAVNYAINNVSNDFTGITGLRGTYKVTIVVSDLPLKKADGTAFTPLTISVPTALDVNGAPTAPVSVTGPALEGYITLTN
jgi:hypothetical protein